MHAKPFECVAELQLIALVKLGGEAEFSVSSHLAALFRIIGSLYSNAE